MAIFRRQASVVGGAARDALAAGEKRELLAEGLEALQEEMRLQEETWLQKSVQVVLFGLPYPCWRCRAVSLALVALGEDGGALDDDDLLVCDDPRVLAFADDLVSDEVRRLGPIGAIKPRYSKRTGQAYLSNGCASCDAIFGEFPLFHEEVPQVLALGGVAGLVRLDTVRLSAEQWDELWSLRWS